LQRRQTSGENQTEKVSGAPSSLLVSMGKVSV
jgi:hypothetical protein